MRELLKDKWSFCKILKDKTELERISQNPEEYLEQIKSDRDSFMEVRIPHDWAIERFETFYQDSIGCYIRSLELNIAEDKRYILYFDGIYMDSVVFINGKRVCEWKYGYTPFEVDITNEILEGSNELLVLVNYYNPNSRWYSGAGITRNVYLDVVPKTYIPRYGLYVNAVKVQEEEWLLKVDTHIYDTTENGDFISYDLEHCIQGENGENMQLKPLGEDEVCPAENGFIVKRQYSISNPQIWDIENPYVYKFKAILNNNSLEESLVGFRSIEFKPDSGFWLNGRNIKLNGACEHHDFGMIGGVFYEDAMERKILTLKAMGVNSIRFSHNPVDEKAIELCDRLGMLVLSEAFDMWLHKKTEYDYARFFKDWYVKDVRAWIRKDRNHPSIIMWSIGNEIYDIHLGPEGRDTVNALSAAVRRYDPYHNAYITFCSNYMPWENAQKAAQDVEVVGYNYAEKYYREHHKEHPDWVIYGSETSSIVYSRSVYRFPVERTCMTDDDRQCSSMGNSTTSWGATSFEACACDDRDMEFSAGQYIWTGFDYLGEPTPYHTKNSYLGQIDTAGFPKDAFYMWQSVWTNANDNPMIYMSPYWDFNEGQLVDIRVVSNACEVEAFINDESLGKKKLTHAPNSGKDVIATYKVPFKKGQIRAVAYDENGKEVASISRSSFKDTFDIICKEEQFYLDNNEYTLGKYRQYQDELKFYDIFAIDEEGNIVENASDLVDVSISGGEFVALDNGDSTDYTDQKSLQKRLFNGRLLLVVRKTDGEEIHVSVKKNEELNPVRKIELGCSGGFLLSKGDEIRKISVKLLPENASDKDIDFRITDMIGNDSGIAELIENNYEADGSIVIKAKGDGEFKVRALSKSSTNDVKIISQLEFKAEGLGEAFKNPYKFIAGSAYSYGFGTMTSGNERGVATARAAETVIVYENVDFGLRGSDNITIPIFALDYEQITIEIYDGVWGNEDCTLICEGQYNHPQIWNVYQEDTYYFNRRLKGIHTLSFRTTEKIHMKGFSSREYNPAFEVLKAVDADKIYGDTYTVKEELIEGIGNNVTIDFGLMDFGEKGAGRVIICGRANQNRNTIHLRFTSQGNNYRSICECDPSDDFVNSCFEVSNINGLGKVELVFLPGCNYDLKWIKFE